MNKRTLVLTICTVVLTFTEIRAQAIAPMDTLQCPAGAGPVRSQVLSSDSISTWTLICIDVEVRPHLHQYHDELVQVLDGEAVMLLADSVISIHAGSVISIPMNTPHAVQVIGDVPLRVISTHSPGMDQSDRVFVEPAAVWGRP
ncbi:MAG: cupin domain-containing protein [Flavobacteriales bacterium]|nr:cupin domain-containing protein [Flavobacteriales bacterium]MBP6573677.1 cupin domain-containing protein [Flavobacteriales bacterium]